MKHLRLHLHRRAALAVALCLLIVACVLPATAQSQLNISQATLRLWPEYDDPGLLVIFTGDFAESASFPQKVTFPVAAGARNVQATMKESDGSLLVQQDWKVEADKLTYTLPKPGFHYEYYVDRPPSGNQRQITYHFIAPYPIKTLAISVQQPARATDFTLTPKPDSNLQGENGLTYYQISRQNLSAGDAFDIVISYSKTDSGLTSPQLAVTNSQSATPAPSTSGPALAPAANRWLPYALIGAGLAALAGIAAYWFFTQRKDGARPARKPAPTPATPAAPISGSSRSAARGFCTQCGNPLRAEDRFCSQCGAPRRGG